MLPSTLAALAALGVERRAGRGDGACGTGGECERDAGDDGDCAGRAWLLLHRTLDHVELEPEMGAVKAGGGEGDASQMLRAMRRSKLRRRCEAEILSEARQPSFGREVAQAVSVAAAYFEDTLSSLPELLLAAGTTGAESLESMLHANGLGGLRVREMMEPGMLDAGAATVRVPRGWLAGVKGALTS